MADQPLQKVLSTATVAGSASIGPRQTEHQKDESRKERRRHARKPSIEETLDQEQAIRDGAVVEDAYHIDYHA